MRLLFTVLPVCAVVGVWQAPPSGPPAQSPAVDASPAALAAMKSALTPSQIEAAIAYGAAHPKERTQGLHLRDVHARDAAYHSYSSTAEKRSQGFSLTIYTPTTWIRERAAVAARANRVLTRAELSDIDTLPLVRIVVYPDVPSFSNTGVRGSSSVTSVQIENEDSTKSLSPLAAVPFEMPLTDARTKARIHGGYMGLNTVFALEGVQALRGSPDAEFFVKIGGTTGEVKRFKLKRKHFDDIP